MKKRQLLYGLLIVLSVTFLALMLTGCSESEPVVNDPFPEMSTDLRTMQGHWETSASNSLTTSVVIFQNYTIRLRHQHDPESPMLKRNASIDRLDESRNLLILNGGSSAWPYLISTVDGEDRLEINFLAHDGWKKIYLKRNETAL